MQPIMNRVLFLDFDGPIRLMNPETWTEEFCEDRMSMISRCLIESDADIVVSSEWRKEGEDMVEDCLFGGRLDRLMHEDWATPVLHQDARWNEIETWLHCHPETTGFAILDDCAKLFDSAPEYIKSRLILCTSRHGFLPSMVKTLNETLQRPWDSSTISS